MEQIKDKETTTNAEGIHDNMITLTDEPLAVNVEILRHFDTKTTVSAKKEAQLAILSQKGINMSGDPNKIIIPLRTSSLTKFRRYSLQYPYSGMVGKVQARDAFPYELAFAMTVHKAQGRTIPRVVLALSKRFDSRNQMKYSSIYVAMSRVEKREHLKFLIHSSLTSSNRRCEIDYIRHLRPAIAVHDYYAGFSSDGSGIWDPQKTLSHLAQQGRL